MNQLFFECCQSGKIKQYDVSSFKKIKDPAYVFQGTGYSVMQLGSKVLKDKHLFHFYTLKTK